MKTFRPPAISSAVFVPDYPHSVLKARFALKRDPRADFPEIILGRLSLYCRQFGILISILPQSPVFVLRIEGALVAFNPEREDCRYVVQNRHLAFGNRSIIDENILSSAFRFVFPAYKRGITTRIGVFEENRDASIRPLSKVPLFRYHRMRNRFKNTNVCMTRYQNSIRNNSGERPE